MLIPYEVFYVLIVVALLSLSVAIYFYVRSRDRFASRFGAVFGIAFLLIFLLFMSPDVDNGDFYIPDPDADSISESLIRSDSRSIILAKGLPIIVKPITSDSAIQLTKSFEFLTADNQVAKVTFTLGGYFLDSPTKEGALKFLLNQEYIAADLLFFRNTKYDSEDIELALDLLSRGVVSTVKPIVSEKALSDITEEYVKTLITDSFSKSDISYIGNIPTRLDNVSVEQIN